jgi:hypothetical protein
MGKYAWKTENRSGTAVKKPNYSVKWEWRDPDLAGSYRQMTDLVYATNAERAINKVRKSIQEDDNFGRPARRDIVIIHVVPIDGSHYEF